MFVAGGRVNSSLVALPGCAPCPPGTYQPNNGTTACLACSTGKYNALTLQITAASCLPCPAGTYCNVAGLSAGIPCPLGSYQTATGLAATCTACPAGSYTTATGASALAACVTCPMGSYCLSGASAPVLCPFGTYGDATGVGSAVCSGTCKPGYYCPQGSVNPTQYVCPAGSYCPDISSWPTPCPAGTWSPQAASSNVSCTSCLAGTSYAGFYRPANQIMPNTFCMTCSSGAYVACGAWCCCRCRRCVELGLGVCVPVAG